MDVGDPAGDRVLDRDHAEFGRSVLYGREGVLEGRAWQRRQVGIIVDAGDMRIGPGFTLIGDRKRFVHARFPGASMMRARSRSSGASTPSGAVSTRAISTRIPASSARNCSSFSRRSSGEGGSGDKSPERLAAIGVETDVVQKPALAPWRAGAGEVERPQPGRSEFGRHRLDDVGIVFLLIARDRRRQRRDVDIVVGERREAGPHDRTLDGRQIALNVDHDVVCAGAVDRTQRLEDAVGPGGVIEAGHHRLAAGGDHRLDDARVIGRDPDRPDVGLHRPAPDMDDHRRAVNVGERLSRQASRAHAGGDEDNRIGHRFRLSDIQSGGLIRVAKASAKRLINCKRSARVPPP